MNRNIKNILKVAMLSGGLLIGATGLVACEDGDGGGDAGDGDGDGDGGAGCASSDAGAGCASADSGS